MDVKGRGGNETTALVLLWYDSSFCPAIHLLQRRQFEQCKPEAEARVATCIYRRLQSTKKLKNCMLAKGQKTDRCGIRLYYVTRKFHTYEDFIIYPMF